MMGRQRTGDVDFLRGCRGYLVESNWGCHMGSCRSLRMRAAAAESASQVPVRVSGALDDAVEGFWRGTLGAAWWTYC
jgi:hypothetical protein